VYIIFIIIVALFGLQRKLGYDEREFLLKLSFARETRREKVLCGESLWRKFPRPISSRNNNKNAPSPLVN